MSYFLLFYLVIPSQNWVIYSIYTDCITWFRSSLIWDFFNLRGFNFCNRNTICILLLLCNTSNSRSPLDSQIPCLACVYNVLGPSVVMVDGLLLIAMEAWGWVSWHALVVDTSWWLHLHLPHALSTWVFLSVVHKDSMAVRWWDLSIFTCISCHLKLTLHFILILWVTSPVLVW